MIKAILKEFENSGRFVSQEVVLSNELAKDWVQMRIDPQRFIPAIFDGDWARPDKHPQPGKIKLLRVISGNDGVTRIIGRQEKNIFVTPWIA